MGVISGFIVENSGELWYNQKINDHSTFRGKGGAGAADDRKIRRREIL